MNNPRINKLLKGCNWFLYEDDFEDKNDLFDHNVYCGTKLVRNNKLTLCDKCKAELLGILGQMKYEVGFLESFDWTISRDACVEGKHKTVYMGFIEHFGFIQEDQENKIKIIKDKIEELNSDIKRIEESLK